MASEFITIAVPALNEEACIEKTVLELQPEDENYELLVLDGGSTDRTREIVASLAKRNPRIRLIDNSGRIQAAAINLAARDADPRSRTIVRADAHCGYSSGFARSVASALEARRREGAVSVVVPMLTEGNENRFQEAVAAAQNSRFGNGGSAHRRRASDSGWIDHGHHAAFDREFFLSIGGYDESFSVNEDGELDIRIHKAGGKVWMESPALIRYFPRKTPAALLKQYFGYGKGRAQNVLKHGSRLKPRQALPVVVFLACILSVLLSPLWPGFLLTPIAYGVACLVLGFTHIAYDKPFSVRILSGFSLCIMHLAWGAGFSIQFAASKISGVIKGGRHAT